jgi:hypothetical protein
MRRPAQRALTDQTGVIPRLKPVFIPHLTPADDAARLVFMDVQSETYDGAGAPRLEFGAPSPDSNALTRIRIAASAVNPTIRQVFIPDWSGNTSFLFEGADGQPGVFIVSFAPRTGDLAEVSIIFAPNTTLLEVSQGDHDGVLQIILPKTDTISTTIELHREPLGYFKYRSLATQVSFTDLSQSEIKDALRQVDLVLADQLSAVFSQVAFELDPPSEAATALVQVDVSCSPTCKKVMVCIVQATGFLATLTGGILAICGSDNPVAQAGAAFAMTGGLIRGGAAFMTALTAPA